MKMLAGIFAGTDFGVRKPIASSVTEIEKLQADLAQRDTYVHELHLARVADAIEIERLRTELRQRDTYVHELHLARIADKKRIEATQNDWVELVRWLEQAEDEREALKRRVVALETPRLSAVWRVLQSRKKVQTPAVETKPVEYPHAPFVYHFRTSPYRVFRESTFLLAGWAFPEDGQPVTALRARVDAQAFSGTYGLAEPEVVAHHGEQAENPGPGFKIVIEIPPGRHRLSLEARLGAGDWVTIVSLPIWARLPA